MGGRGSSSGGGGGGGSSISDSWTTPTGNKITVEIDKETSSFNDDWGGSHELKYSALEVKSFTFNGEAKDAKFGIMQHKDKIMFKVDGKPAAAVMPSSLQAKIDKYYTNLNNKSNAIDKKLREEELRLKRANGSRGSTW